MIAIVTSVVCLYIFVQTHHLNADRGVQRTLRFSITSRPLINVKSGSHMKKKPVITQKIRNDRVDQDFGRKWSKCRDVIFDHTLGNTMGAIGGRALVPMFLHPLQYGVANLGKAYCKQYNALQLIKEKYVLSWRQNMANSTKLSFYNSIKKDYKIEKHLYLKKNFTQGKCSHNFELAIINSKLKMVDTKTFLVTNDYANTVTLVK